MIWCKKMEIVFFLRFLGVNLFLVTAATNNTLFLSYTLHIVFISDHMLQYIAIVKFKW